MRRLTTLIITLATLAPASLALAGTDSARYAWARVIEAEPVTRIIRRPVEERVCWQEEVYREVPERHARTPRILGAVVGGVIGNQFGGGHGRDAMTLAGAALGSSMVADHQRQKYPRRYYAGTEDRCGYNSRWRETERIIGWDVVYEYRGETYSARLPDEPGDQIRIEVAVRPAQ